MAGEKKKGDEKEGDNGIVILDKKLTIGNNFNFRIYLLFPNKQITIKDTNISVICYSEDLKIQIPLWDN